MKELVIISGKGGTGKTSLTAAFASLAANHLICDADVDAADLHLLTAPTIRQTSDFMGGSIATIREADCSKCGTCLELCRFGAISECYTIDPISCEGCGVCVDLCPEQAIDFPIQKCGEWFFSDTRFGPMLHARLGIAEENSGKLVSLIRQQAKLRATELSLQLIITDGPPGIGCPVIASITGATAVLLVVEPTLSGLHDMKRIADLVEHFKIPLMLCINKYDINLEVSKSIEEEARKRHIELVGHIPFDPEFVHAMVLGKNIIEHGKNQNLINQIRKIWAKVISSEKMNAGDVQPVIPTIQK